MKEVVRRDKICILAVGDEAIDNQRQTARNPFIVTLMRFVGEKKKSYFHHLTVGVNERRANTAFQFFHRPRNIFFFKVN